MSSHPACSQWRTDAFSGIELYSPSMNLIDVLRLIRSGLSSTSASFALVLLIIVGGVGTAAMMQARTGTGGEGTPASTATASSLDGIQLTVSSNASELAVGQSLSVKLSITNTLSMVNTVKPANEWLMHGVPVALWPPCYFGLPAQVAVLQGSYDAQDIHAVTDVSFNYMCMEAVGIDHIVFQPNSDQVNLTGLYSVNQENQTLGPFHLSLSFTTGGYWNLQTLSGELNIPILGQGYPSDNPAYTPFTPGEYTIAAADEWGQLSILHLNVVPAPTGAVVLAVGTTFSVSSSYDCAAGHYEVPFVAYAQSVLSGSFSAGTPGVSMYVATAQQASTVFQGHPSAWVYSTGTQVSANLTVPLGSGSYVLWFEGADENCGATVVMPLEQLTDVNVTQAFTVNDAPVMATGVSSA